MGFSNLGIKRGRKERLTIFRIVQLTRQDSSTCPQKNALDQPSRTSSGKWILECSRSPLSHGCFQSQDAALFLYDVAKTVGCKPEAACRTEKDVVLPRSDEHLDLPIVAALEQSTVTCCRFSGGASSNLCQNENLIEATHPNADHLPKAIPS